MPEPTAQVVPLSHVGSRTLPVAIEFMGLLFSQLVQLLSNQHDPSLTPVQLSQLGLQNTSERRPIHIAPDTRMTAKEFGKTDALVGVIMGSRSDWETMSAACEVLESLDISHERTVVSAHRTPKRMFAYADSAAERGLKVIIAGAGGAAHLPGMVASETNLPVIGVPVQSRALQGLDSLLSIAQMPGGIPVATMSIGSSGAKNAAILAARILALSDDALASRLSDFVQKQTQAVLDATEL